MLSPAQLAANQANAQRSTGPRTGAGKSRAAQNARRHGLTSAHLVILESDREIFDSMHAALAEEIAPQGELEQTLFDTLLHADWNIRRCRLLEAQLMEADTDPMLLEQNEAKLRQLDRHARRHDTNFHRALKELKALQTEREFRGLAAVSPAPPLASTRLARQAARKEHAAILDHALARLVSKPDTKTCDASSLRSLAPCAHRPVRGAAPLPSPGDSI